MTENRDDAADAHNTEVADPAVPDAETPERGGDAVPQRLLPWADRSPVAAAMFNPAVVAVIIAAATNQYEDVTGDPMPWPLAYLVPPLVLHGPTRSALPRTSRTSLPNWVNKHPVLNAGFPARARHLAPTVREGLRFALRENALQLTADGESLTNTKLKAVKKTAPGDLALVVLASGMLGRIFGRTRDPATIFATLRVRP